jgi:hypothetical protein
VQGERSPGTSAAGQEETAVSTEKRDILSSSLVKSVKFHFTNYSAQQIEALRVERSRSNYPHAKSDLVIFNGQGEAVIKGHEFGGGQTSLWAV